VARHPTWLSFYAVGCGNACYFALAPRASDRRNLTKMVKK